MPNVTAIDWKQADVFGPDLEHQGGMSFTVQEARAAFSFRVLPARITLACSRKLVVPNLEFVLSVFPVSAALADIAYTARTRIQNLLSLGTTWKVIADYKKQRADETPAT